jgi:membrane protein YdbS with pleckstrin-like domain
MERHPVSGTPERRGPRAGWMVLRRLLRVPEEAPELPPGRHEWARSFRPADAWFRYLILKHVLGWGLALALAVVVGAVALLDAGGAAVLIVGAGVLLVLFFFIAGLVAIPLRFDTTWYVMTDRALRLRSGIWTIQEMTVTFENVQNVRVRRGPIQRFLGIGDVTVETAAVGHADPSQGTTSASSAVIAGVDDPVDIRDRIIERMRMSRSAGLGDEAAGARRARVEGAGQWSPAHLELLRGIRDEVRAMRGE